MRAKGQSWEGDVKSNEYSGTYRWSQRNDFPQLGKPPGALDLSGWQGYLGTRIPDDGTDKLVADVAMLDSLSFPLSFVFAMRELLTSNGSIKDWLYGGERKLTIAALGTAERAEEHVLLHTDYFREISYMMPSFHIHLWLVGPEMSTSGHRTSMKLGEKMVGARFRGTFADFAAEQKLLDGESGKVVIIVFNSGMASGDAALRSSWRADVRRLLRHNVLSIFTCANDHSDLKNEKELMAGLGARYVLEPRKNAFSAVTTLHPPGQKDTGWYCANAFIYAVQGSASGQPETGASSGNAPGAAQSQPRSKSEEEGGQPRAHEAGDAQEGPSVAEAGSCDDLFMPD